MPMPLLCSPGIGHALVLANDASDGCACFTLQLLALQLGRHYSANLMRVAIYGRESLDELEVRGGVLLCQAWGPT